MNIMPSSNHFAYLLICVTFVNSVAATPLFKPTLLLRNGAEYQGILPSTVVFSPSNPDLIVVGSILGDVQLIRVQRSGYVYTVSAILSTISVGENRTILGISADIFAPNTFYVSTNVLEWREKGFGENGWQNGRVERVTLSEKRLSLNRDHEPFISGLPVSLSPFGFGVFGSVTNPNNGRLFLSIATMNNGGAASAIAGNIGDSIISAAMLEVDIRNRSLSRTLRWSTADPSTASLLDGPEITGISIYATGLRSCYQPVVSRAGRLFVFDAGSSFDGGPRSTACNYSIPYARSQPDRLIHVKSGKWYGHANRRRGQCTTVPRLLSKKKAVARFPGYTPPRFNNEVWIQSGVVGTGSVGAAFYDANVFPGFRGMLISGDADNDESSDFSEKRPLGLNVYDKKKKKVTRLTDTPGISLAIDVFGSVFAAQPQRDRIGVAIPSSGMRKNPGIRNVFPVRGLPGSRLFVYAEGVSLQAGITIGGVPCTHVSLAIGGKLLSCIVGTPMEFSSVLDDVVVDSFRLRNAFSILNPAYAVLTS